MSAVVPVGQVPQHADAVLHDLGPDGVGHERGLDGVQQRLGQPRQAAQAPPRVLARRRRVAQHARRVAEHYARTCYILTNSYVIIINTDLGTLISFLFDFRTEDLR